jgi:hypothetical protein
MQTRIKVLVAPGQAWLGGPQDVIAGEATGKCYNSLLKSTSRNVLAARYKLNSWIIQYHILGILQNKNYMYLLYEQFYKMITNVGNKRAGLRTFYRMTTNTRDPKQWTGLFRVQNIYSELWHMRSKSTSAYRMFQCWHAGQWKMPGISQIFVGFAVYTVLNSIALRISSLLQWTRAGYSSDI